MSSSIPPSEVTLVYRRVGCGHAFTAEGMHEFYIGSATLKQAYELAICGLGEHASRRFGTPVHYTSEMSFEEFEKLIHSQNPLANFVCARRSLVGETAHA